MSQQINLYQPIFKKEQKVFSAVTLLQGWGIVLFALLLLFAYVQWQSQQLQRQVKAAEQQRETSTRQLAELQQRFPERSKDPALQLQVEAAAQKIRAREQVVSALHQRSLGNRDGFSEQLSALARQRLANLWLTHLAIAQGGESIELSGSAYQPELVPRYLQRLSGETIFSGSEFEQFTMQRPEQQPGQVDFALRSRAEEKKK